MIVLVSVIATVLTVLRSWPQFIRIVLRNNTNGVSSLTWGMALANHSAWLTFAVLAQLPLLVATNALAAIGCGAILWKVRAPQLTVGTCLGAVLAAAGLFQLGEAVVLIVINGLALAMFVPQAVNVIRGASDGVSTMAWAISASSSVSWIVWGFMIGRPTLVVAHFFMLPTSLVIATLSALQPAADVKLAAEQ